MPIHRRRFRIEEAFIGGDVPMPAVADGEIGPMHHEIMSELRAIRAQMAAAPAAAAAAARPCDRRRSPRGRRGPGAAGNLSRPDRAVREAQGRTRPDLRRHQPHQARNRGAARQELQRRGNGQGQRRTRRRGRRHRRSHPADSGSRRSDRPGGQRAVQGDLAGPAEAAQRGNPGTRRFDLRGLQFPGPDRSAHQQGDDHDEVHRKPHHRHDGYLGWRRRDQGARAADRRRPAKATPSCSNGPKLDGDAGHASQNDIDALFD